MIPVILFVYARTDHLLRTLECLKENKVPKLYIYSDGAKTKENVSDVNEVRTIIRAIDWCETVITERDTNLGLGTSILTGVSEVLEKEEMAIVVEDDLICVPGTYAYLSAALDQYKDNPKVMSVTGWTHPVITPTVIIDQPYFDGRAECWIWGTWKRAWAGIQKHTAESLMNDCEDPEKYGYDLPGMAKNELRQNIWAVRFLYWHIVNKGLCMRPPWSMVSHIGFDTSGTNVKSEIWTKSPQLNPCPTIPEKWPEAIENPQCAELHRNASKPNAIIRIVGVIKSWVS